MMRIWFLTAAMSGALLAGCSSISVTTDYDPGFQFSKLGTFAWLPAPEPSEGGHPLAESPLINDRVREAVTAELAARGFREAAEGEADVLLQNYAAVEAKVQVDTMTHSYRYGPYWGGPGYVETQVHEYEEGSLVLDVIDAATRELAWRGVARARIYEERTPEERAARIREAVQRLLEDFPPK